MSCKELFIASLLTVRHHLEKFQHSTTGLVSSESYIWKWIQSSVVESLIPQVVFDISIRHEGENKVWVAFRSVKTNTEETNNIWVIESLD